MHDQILKDERKGKNEKTE